MLDWIITKFHFMVDCTEIFCVGLFGAFVMLWCFRLLDFLLKKTFEEKKLDAHE